MPEGGDSQNNPSVDNKQNVQSGISEVPRVDDAVSRPSVMVGSDSATPVSATYRSDTLGFKRRRVITKALLIINSIVLLPTALMMVATLLLGAAAIVPALLLVAFIPVIGILLITDFVVLTIFLFKRIFRKELFNSWPPVAALAAWLMIGVVFVPLVRATTHSIQDRREHSKGQKLLTKEAAVELVRTCKVSQFYRVETGNGAKFTSLDYKDSNMNSRASTQHNTAAGNFDALLLAALQSIPQCGAVSDGGGVTSGTSQGGFAIGASAENAANSRTVMQPPANLIACYTTWAARDKFPLSDQTILRTGQDNDGTTVKVVQVVHNPPTTGDVADVDTQYLEVDLSIAGPMPTSVSYTPSSYPQCGLSSVGAVDDANNDFNPLANTLEQAKKVSIPGKISIATNPSGATRVYALFEVKPGDTGYFSWTDSYNISNNIVLD